MHHPSLPVRKPIASVRKEELPKKLTEEEAASPVLRSLDMPSIRQSESHSSQQVRTVYIAVDQPSKKVEVLISPPQKEWLDVKQFLYGVDWGLHVLIPKHCSQSSDEADLHSVEHFNVKGLRQQYSSKGRTMVL
ncbi:hypothetical protein J6590_017027 [Homalodisca vitripennis]|nr:hypothetical protein J6590_017027 [Homalodisca vitripennis]